MCIRDSPLSPSRGEGGVRGDLRVTRETQSMSSAPRVSGFVLILTLWLSSLPATAQPPAPALREGKPGGVLRAVLREDLPQGFAIHEAATNSVTWPAMPCYSNLMIYDPVSYTHLTLPTSDLV